LKTRRGTGWKPYNRANWFAASRMENGRTVSPQARWDAWEAKKERESRRLDRATWIEIGPTNLSGCIIALAFHPTDPATPSPASGDPAFLSGNPTDRRAGTPPRRSRTRNVKFCKKIECEEAPPAGTALAGSRWALCASAIVSRPWCFG
jgi:hypothetical protein